MMSCHWWRLDSTARVSRRLRQVIGPACSRARYCLWICFGARLVVELQSELNDARIGCGQDIAESHAITRDVRRAEIRAVERVEQFGAELKVISLRQVKVLRQSEVEIY